MLGARCGKGRCGPGPSESGSALLLSYDKDLMSFMLQLIDCVEPHSKKPALSLEIRDCCLTPIGLNSGCSLANQNDIKDTILAQRVLYFSALCFRSCIADES